MTRSNYTVASASQLVGAKPPKRRKANKLHVAEMKATDQANKDQSFIARSADVRRHGRVKGGLSSEADGGEQANNLTPTIVVNDNNSTHVAQLLTTPPPPQPLPVRNKQLQAGHSISARYQAQAGKTDKIDTSFDQHPDGRRGPVRDANSAEESQLNDIYFSPIDVNKSQISLSDPLDVAESDLTPTQERYIGSQRKLETAKYQRPSEDQWQTKLTLQPEHVDRLIKTLAETPLLQVHVRKQWWDDIADDGSVISDATPSLTSNSASSSSSSQASGQLYSQLNVPFLTEQRSPSVVQAILEEEFARDYPDHPNAKKLLTPVAGIKFGGIALTDPKVHGSPIRYISKDYRLGSKVLQVGACSFMDVPYGTSVQSSIRILRPSTLSENCTVLLQIVNQVIERKTGKKTFLLVAEVDVTESFTRAALTELASHSDTPFRDIEVLTNDQQPKQADEDSIDWCALADELEMSCAVTEAVEAAASSFSSLSTEFCTMQTLTLMSELERIKTQHQDFLVFRPTGYHDNGTPSGINNPWISQHLDQKLHDVDFNSRGQASDLARHLRERLLDAVIDRFAAGVPFDSRIVFDGQIRMIQAVPLLEGTADGGSRPAAWVCFLSGIQDGLFRR